jgi:hypothetical protein
MGQMVENQTANQTAKPLKEGKKKKQRKQITGSGRVELLF